MKVQFTNENVVRCISIILNQFYTECDDEIFFTSCLWCDAEKRLRALMLKEMNIVTQSAFEVASRFSAILKSIIYAWESYNTKDCEDLEKANSYINENAIEISELIDWTETSDIMAMDYLVEKEVNL